MATFDALQQPKGAKCPKCGHAESWSTWVGTQGHAMGMCHRAQCGHVTRLDGAGATMRAKPAAREPRHYTRPYRALTDDQAAIIRARFGLPSDAVDGYNEWDDRFILGVTGPAGQPRGHIAYSLSGGTPKSVNYVSDIVAPFIHWATVQTPGAVVVVEDWWSAEKVREAGLAHGVALNGTKMPLEVAAEIANVGNKAGVPTYLALDRDAYAKSVQFQSKWKSMFSSGLYLWALDRDLKYCTVERINAAIELSEFNFSRDYKRQGSI